MDGRLNLKRKALNILIILCCIVFIGWGNVGHRVINRNATLSFLEEIEFLLYWADGLANHGSDADYRKGNDPGEEKKHYIDIDNFPEFIATGRITPDFDSLVAMHGYDFVMQQGILPWAILATCDSLEDAFRNYEWNRAMLLSADLGHYVGDAHVPLHLTRNYNGQYTNQYGVHSRYESRMIESYTNRIFYNGDNVGYISDMSDAVFDMIYHNYLYVDSVLIADKMATAIAGNTESTAYYDKLWELSGSFTIHLLESASTNLAAMIYTCWINAGSPKAETSVYAAREPIKDFMLYQNYPNPFNSQTNIAFELDKQAEISIAIFNLKGQMVAEVCKGIREPGYHNISWNAGDVGAGMYIIRMKAGNITEMKKCVLIK